MTANEDEKPVRAVAKVSGEDVRRTGRIYLPGPERRPVFVDDSGRRGRWLTWVSVLIALAGLVLIGALWVSQVSSTGA